VPSPAVRLADVITLLDEWYDPRWAEPWDAVGLVCGNPDAEIRRVLFAVDPVLAVAQEAVALRADLLVAHHPLFLRPVHGVPATTAKGRLVHHLIGHGIALHVVHTNADSAAPGVSDALARALGLAPVRPLAAHPAEPQDKLVTFVPHGDAERIIDALADAGAGVIGDYTRCAWTVAGTGTFRPEPGTHPVIGTVGAVEQVPETRVEMVLPRSRRAAVVGALAAAHPYEEPAYDVYELAAAAPGRRGMGRVCELAEPERLREFVERVRRGLPRTPSGVRVAGDADRPVRTVAVSGGAGDSLLPAARAAGVDVFLTADLRHHPASEALEEEGPALVDVAHWASEWPWLVEAAQRLADATTVEAHVSRTVTDPWTAVANNPEETR
jgi:dinuclear metal center YbgI/SA1388 family protein